MNKNLLKYVILTLLYLAFGVALVFFILLTLVLCAIAIVGIILLIIPGILAIIWFMIVLLCGTIYEKIEMFNSK